MTLPVPLSQDQIDAASHMYAQMDQWQVSDAALLRLRATMPGFDREACLIKSVTINALYGTQVFAIVRMAAHVHEVLNNISPGSAGLDLVEKLAALPPTGGGRKIRFISFAAKFCHFFVDKDRFPIYDEAARNALRLHLGRSLYQNDERHPYTAFGENLDRLRSEAQLAGSGRELDRYLWITGMYIKWLKERDKPKAKVNTELRGVFEDPDPQAKDSLNAILPAVLLPA